VDLAHYLIPKIVNFGGYAAQDIYKQDETGQFFVSCRSACLQQATEQAERKTISTSQCFM
jgi:hypothetical protein